MASSSSSSSSSIVLPKADKHNLLAYLLKPKGAEEFYEIIDFLKESNLKFALTVNQTIYTSHLNDFWTSAEKVEQDGVTVIVGKVGEKVIKVSESSIRTHLQLLDADGMDCYPPNQIFDSLVLLGYEGERNKLTFYKSMFSPQWKYLIHTLQQCISQKKTSWDQFSSNIASALICLANNLKFNFSKMIFNGMLYNLEHTESKILMYPRFLQYFFDKELTNLPSDGGKIVLLSHTKKLFSNMRRTGSLKGIAFSGRVTPLTAHMTCTPSTAEVAQPSSTSAPTDEAVVTPSTAQPTPVVTTQRKTRDPHPTKRKAQRAKKQTSEAPLPQMSQPQNINEVVNESGDDHVERAATTASTPVGVQDSSNVLRTQSTATLDTEEPMDTSNAEVPLVTNVSSGPSTKNKGASVVHARHDAVGGSNDPLKGVNTPGSGEDSSLLQELTNTCTNLCDVVKKQGEEIEEQRLFEA